MLINSLASPSCDLKLINGKNSNKGKTKTTNKQWIKSEKIYVNRMAETRGF
jgi:hypothetical protein